MDDLPHHPVFDPQDPFTFVSQYGRAMHMAREADGKCFDEDVLMYFERWSGYNPPMRLFSACGRAYGLDTGSLGVDRHSIEQSYPVSAATLSSFLEPANMLEILNSSFHGLRARVMVKHEPKGRMGLLYSSYSMGLKARG